MRIHNICGNQPDIALLHNEHTSPPDGVVFIERCRGIAGMTNQGGSETVAVNHLELGWITTSTSWIETYLVAS